METDKAITGRSVAGLVVRAAAAAAAAIMVCGCNTDQQVTTGAPEAPTDYRLRHPITLQESRRTLELFIGSNRGELNPTQRAQVLSFGLGWKRAATGGMVVQRPIGSSNAGAVASGLEAYGGRAAGVMFALALLDASIIGALAVSLSTAYAIGDVLTLRHSLHRKATDAKGFYAVYAGLIAVAAALVLFGSDALLGLLTTAVQTLAGVLLPSATVFLLLLCNDKAVLGPWVNGRWLNVFTGAVIWVLVMLSIVLTAATLFPGLSGLAILTVLGSGSAVGVLGFGVFAALRRNDWRAKTPSRG